VADNQTVEDFIEDIDNDRRRRDARTLLDLMGRITGENPRLWGRIVGFGQYHYEYESGRKGDGPAASFAPRKAAMSIYLPDGIGAHGDALERLGPHTTGVGCLYVKDLEKLDLDVLEDIVSRSYSSLTSGTYGKRAREGGKE
jgi:hypothetical protein